MLCQLRVQVASSGLRLIVFESSLTLACCITITLLAPPALLILSSQVSSPVSIITLQGSQFPAQPQHRVCNSPNRGNQRQRGFIISLPGQLTHAPTTHTLPLAAASRTSDTQKPRKTQKGCSEFSGRLLAGHDIALTFLKTLSHLRPPDFSAFLAFHFLHQQIPSSFLVSTHTPPSAISKTNTESDFCSLRLFASLFLSPAFHMNTPHPHLLLISSNTPLHAAAYATNIVRSRFCCHSQP